MTIFRRLDSQFSQASEAKFEAMRTAFSWTIDAIAKRYQSARKVLNNAQVWYGSSTLLQYPVILKIYLESNHVCAQQHIRLGYEKYKF